MSTLDSAPIRIAALIERIGRFSRAREAATLPPAQWEALRFIARANSFSRQPRAVAAWLATIDRDLKRGGYSAFRHFDTVIKLSQHCEQNRPCFSRMTDAELVAAVDALGGEGARK